MANCYQCKYRSEVPGDAHSMCHHPLIKQDDNAFGALIDMITGKNTEAAVKLNIRANPHGVRNGWFFWPANFDPAWLENCDGFTQKD